MQVELKPLYLHSEEFSNQGSQDFSLALSHRFKSQLDIKTFSIKSILNDLDEINKEYLINPNESNPKKAKNPSQDILPSSAINNAAGKNNHITTLLELEETIEQGSYDLLLLPSFSDLSSGKKFVSEESYKLMSLISTPTLLIPENAQYQGVQNILLAVDRFYEEQIDITFPHHICNLLNSQISMISQLSIDGINPTKNLEYWITPAKENIKFIESENIDKLDLIESINTNEADIIAMPRKNNRFIQSLIHPNYEAAFDASLDTPILIY